MQSTRFEIRIQNPVIFYAFFHRKSSLSQPFGLTCCLLKWQLLKNVGFYQLGLKKGYNFSNSLIKCEILKYVRVFLQLNFVLRCACVI